MTAVVTGAAAWDRLYHVNLRAPFLLAPDLTAPRGAIANISAVAPGGTATAWLGKWLDQTGRAGPSADAVMVGLLAESKVATPARIADVVLFLLSLGAGWINGAILTADNSAHLSQGQDP